MQGHSQPLSKPKFQVPRASCSTRNTAGQYKAATCWSFQCAQTSPGVVVPRIRPPAFSYRPLPARRCGSQSRWKVRRDMNGHGPGMEKRSCYKKERVRDKRDKETKSNNKWNCGSVARGLGTKQQLNILHGCSLVLASSPRSGGAGSVIPLGLCSRTIVSPILSLLARQLDSNFS